MNSRGSKAPKSREILQAKCAPPPRTKKPRSFREVDIFAKLFSLVELQNEKLRTHCRSLLAKDERPSLHTSPFCRQSFTKLYGRLSIRCVGGQSRQRRNVLNAGLAPFHHRGGGRRRLRQVWGAYQLGAEHGQNMETASVTRRRRVVLGHTWPERGAMRTQSGTSLQVWTGRSGRKLGESGTSLRKLARCVQDQR